MIEMLISGHADPAALAELAKGRMRSKIPALTETMESRWQPHHTVVAHRILAHIGETDRDLGDDFYNQLRDPTQRVNHHIRQLETIKK